MLVEDKEDQESEDQSKDTKNKSDNSDETSEEDDSSEDDNEGADKTQGNDAEDLLRQYSRDPNSVDPKLRPVIKRLVGIHTKRMQEISMIKKKAEALDSLAVDPEFQKWAQKRRQQVLNKKSTSRNDDDDDDTSDDDDDDRPLTIKDLRKEMSRLNKTSAEKEQLENDKRELAQFKKSHSDWEMYSETMKEILEEYPRMSYARAYKLAKLETDGDEELTDEEKQSKKRANVSKPSKTSGRDADKKGKKMSILEAFQLAKKKHGF